MARRPAIQSSAQYSPANSWPRPQCRLTAEAEKHLFEAVDKHSNPMLRLIVRIALETGMRASEIAT